MNIDAVDYGGYEPQYSSNTKKKIAPTPATYGVVPLYFLDSSIKVFIFINLFYFILFYYIDCD